MKSIIVEDNAKIHGYLLKAAQSMNNFPYFLCKFQILIAVYRVMFTEGTISSV